MDTSKSQRRRVKRHRNRLMDRMYIAISALFGIFFAFMMVVVHLLAIPYWIAIILTLLLLLAQWWWGPTLIKWFFKIKWLKTEAEARKVLGDPIYDYVQEMASRHKVKFPRLGIVEDDNPNAFTFGRTRNDAWLVITRGIQKYCDPEETKAVVAHEMGHIIHNDFVIMTVVAAVPLILYVTWRGILESQRHSSGNNKGNGYILIVAAVAYLTWILSQLIALSVSRFREYYADDFAARTTGDANKLSTALIKIAYGLTKEMGKKNTKVKGTKKDTTLVKNKMGNAMMFQSPAIARGFATLDLGAIASPTDIRNIEKAMEWDERNVWARLFELNMTHPLTSKRIKAMGHTAREQGKDPIISPDLKWGSMLWRDFAKDVVYKYTAAAGLLLTIYFIYTWQISMAIFTGTVLIGIALCVYYITYRYPINFKEATVEELILDPKAGPVHGRPVRIKGKVVGRGIPGLKFSEDLKLDDGTGIMLLEYHQVSAALNFFIGLFMTKEKIDKYAVIDGWYRRGPLPYVEIYKMYWTNDKKEKKTSTCYTYPFKVAMSLGLVVFGGILLAMLPMGLIGILLAPLFGLSVLLLIPMLFWMGVGMRKGDKEANQLEPEADGKDDKQGSDVTIIVEEIKSRE